jgi:hypothetical protein
MLRMYATHLVNVLHQELQCDRRCNIRRGFKTTRRRSETGSIFRRAIASPVTLQLLMKYVMYSLCHERDSDGYRNTPKCHHLANGVLSQKAIQLEHFSQRRLASPHGVSVRHALFAPLACKNIPLAAAPAHFHRSSCYVE